MSGPPWRSAPPDYGLTLTADFDAAARCAAVTEVYRLSRDLFLAQRFARHVSPLTTVIYTSPSDEELFRGIRGMRC